MADPDLSAESATVRAMVVDDNLVVRLGLTNLLEASGKVTVVAEAANGRQAVAQAERCRPDVVLLDIRMPEHDGLDALPALSGIAQVIIVTCSQDRLTVGQAMRGGAIGYLVHGHFTSAEIVEAVVAAAAGQPHLSPLALAALVENFKTTRQPSPAMGGADQPYGLSPRETEILAQIVRGRTNGEIARSLFLSEKTVKNHINRIYAKLRARNRAEAIALWLGLATHPGEGPRT